MLKDGPAFRRPLPALLERQGTSSGRWVSARCKPYRADTFPCAHNFMNHGNVEASLARHWTNMIQISLILLVWSLSDSYVSIYYKSTLK